MDVLLHQLTPHVGRERPGQQQRLARRRLRNPADHHHVALKLRGGVAGPIYGSVGVAAAVRRLGLAAGAPPAAAEVPVRLRPHGRRDAGRCVA